MRISYDSKYDVLYLKFAEGTPQVTTENLTEDVAFDYDEKGKVVGIEFLSALQVFRFGLPSAGQCGKKVGSS